MVEVNKNELFALLEDVDDEDVDEDKDNAEEEEEEEGGCMYSTGFGKLNSQQAVKKDLESL